MTIQFKLFTGIILVIVIFILDFVVNQRLSKEVIQNTSYISNSEALIRNSNVLNKYMIDMQSGFRGYLLTDQEDFLQTYDRGLRIIPPILAEQHRLVHSDIQEQRLDSILLLHHQWIAYSSALIAARKDSLPGADQRYQELFDKKLKTQVGKNINDAIREIFYDFDAYEYRIRQERRNKLQASIENTRKVSLTLTLFSIGVALISSIYIIRLITSRISKMVTLAEEITKGNFQTIKDNQHDELQRLSTSLNTMSLILEKNFNDLTRKNRELDEFAYVVSHDLKAPLRGIDNITQWIEEDHEKDLTPDIRKNLDLIKGRARRLENMINGLLDYARIGKVKRGPEKVNVEKLLLELSDLLVPPHFQFILETKMPVLLTDKLHIEQVFSNLISNAVKYNNKPSGKIVISAQEHQAHCTFSVSDNGIGIDKQYFHKIFTIFQTLQERDAFESTGVGLAIVKKIIEDHRGTISVHSEIEKGTTFTFTWPKEEQATAEEENGNQ